MPDVFKDCEFIGWVLIDLDEPTPKEAYKAAEALGIRVEDFINQALREKLDRMTSGEVPVQRDSVS